MDWKGRVGLSTVVLSACVWSCVPGHTVFVGATDGDVAADRDAGTDPSGDGLETDCDVTSPSDNDPSGDGPENNGDVTSPGDIDPCNDLVLFEESFAHNLDGFSPMGGTWAVNNGWVELSSPSVGSPAGNRLFLNAAFFGSYDLLVRAQVPDETAWDDLVVIVGGQDEEHFYYAAFNEQDDDATHGFFVYREGVATEIVSFTAQLTAGVTYDIRLTIAGSSFAIHLDDMVVGSGIADEALEGMVGVGSSNNRVLVDDLIVETDSCDAEMPSAPEYITATPLTSAVHLAWPFARDDRAVTAYSVYRDNVILEGMPIRSLTFDDQDIVIGSTYTYTVKAHDAAGNMLLSDASVVFYGLPDRSYFDFLHEQAFEDDTLGVYLETEWRGDWNRTGTMPHGPTQTEIAVDSDSRYNKVMRGHYEEGTIGPAYNNGFNFGSPITSIDEAYFSYDVKFKEGFDFVIGGKLPGLTSVPIPNPGHVPDGSDEEGFMAILMWKENGRLVSYVYHMDAGSLYGSTWGWDPAVYFATNTWYNITIRVRLNTVGSSDGFMEGWVDGERRFLMPNIRFRTESAMHIDDLYICSFFGGGSDIWAATRNETIDFDNFVAWTYTDQAPGVPPVGTVHTTEQRLLHPYRVY